MYISAVQYLLTDFARSVEVTLAAQHEAMTRRTTRSDDSVIRL